MKRVFSTGSYLIVAAAILWGLDGILRRSLFSLSPIVIVFYEHLIGAILLLPFFLKNFKKEKLNGQEWAAIIFVSLLSGVLGTLWFTIALLKVEFIPFSVVFLLQKLQPLFAVFFGVVLLKEKIKPRYLLWAILALASAYFVTFPNGVVNLVTGKETIIAALFAVGAAFAWGSSTAFSRFALINHSHTFITSLRFVLVTIMSFVFVLVMNQFSALGMVEFSQFGRLLLITLTTGMVALWIYYRGLKQTETKISTILELALPATAVVIDLVLYKTALVPMQYLAGLVLVYAIYQVGRKVAN